jgi:hypothetical protein
VEVGEVATASPGDEDFFADAVGTFEQCDAAATLRGLRGAEQASGTSAEDDSVVGIGRVFHDRKEKNKNQPEGLPPQLQKQRFARREDTVERSSVVPLRGEVSCKDPRIETRISVEGVMRGEDIITAFVREVVDMTAAEQWRKFLAKYDNSIAALAQAAVTKLRKQVPGAVEMVYDNYNALVMGFGPSEKASLAVFSIVLYPRYVSLAFLQGAGLPDPGKRLRGEGKLVRGLRLTTAGVLEEPEVRELIAVAKERAKVRIDPGQKRKLIIKSVSKKQRPRKPTK